MNIQKLRKQWFPVLLETQLKQKPISVSLLGEALVLVRLAGEVCCFSDCCPHRHVPLSDGSVQQNTLQCCYHGWRFDQDGQCVQYPEHALLSYAVSCQQGVIWLRLEGDQAFHDWFAAEQGFDSYWAKKSVKADFLHSIENFLDPMHTPYVHKGVFRGQGEQTMQVSQSADAASFATVYQLEQQQNGWINRLFDPGVDKNIASFHYPGFAEIQYWQGAGKHFQVAIFFVPEARGEVCMMIKVSVKKTRLPSWLKFMLLKPFMLLAFYQDKKILEKQYQHHQKSRVTYALSPHDLVIDHLLHLFSDAKAGKLKKLTLHLK